MSKTDSDKIVLSHWFPNYSGAVEIFVYGTNMEHCITGFEDIFQQFFCKAEVGFCWQCSTPPSKRSLICLQKTSFLHFVNECSAWTYLMHANSMTGPLNVFASIWIYIWENPIITKRRSHFEGYNGSFKIMFLSDKVQLPTVLLLMKVSVTGRLANTQTFLMFSNSRIKLGIAHVYQILRYHR